MAGRSNFSNYSHAESGVGAGELVHERRDPRGPTGGEKEAEDPRRQYFKGAPPALPWLLAAPSFLYFSRGIRVRMLLALFKCVFSLFRAFPAFFFSRSFGSTTTGGAPSLFLLTRWARKPPRRISAPNLWTAPGRNFRLIMT